MERILYIWAIRHPASGYVQGINDLLTPLYVVFLSAHVGKSGALFSVYRPPLGPCRLALPCLASVRRDRFSLSVRRARGVYIS